MLIVATSRDEERCWINHDGVHHIDSEAVHFERFMHQGQTASSADCIDSNRSISKPASD